MLSNNNDNNSDRPNSQPISLVCHEQVFMTRNGVSALRPRYFHNWREPPPRVSLLWKPHQRASLHCHPSKFRRYYSHLAPRRAGESRAQQHVAVRGDTTAPPLNISSPKVSMDGLGHPWRWVCFARGKRDQTRVYMLLVKNGKHLATSIRNKVISDTVHYGTKIPVEKRWGINTKCKGRYGYYETTGGKRQKLSPPMISRQRFVENLF